MIVDPDFCDHWKTRMLVDSLNGDEVAPLYVIRLWAHCQSRRAWVFEKLPAAAIRAICRCSIDAAELEQGLTNSGFIERDGDTLTVIGWDEYNATLIANWRNGKKGGRPKKSPKGTLEEKPTVNPSKTHGLAMENPSETDMIGSDVIGFDENSTTAASGDTVEAVYLTRKKRKLTGKRLETFERFWIAFSHRKDKASAADSWLDIPQLTTPLVDEIVAAATAAAAGRAALTADGKTAQYAQGWITARRWEDEATTVQATMTIARPKETPEPENWRKAMEIKLEAAPVPLMKFKAGKAEAHWRQVDPTMQRDLIEIIKEHEL